MTTPGGIFTTLATKIAVILLGLFCLIGFGFILGAQFFLERYLTGVTQELHRSTAESVVSDVLTPPRSFDDRDISSLFDSLMAINPQTELYLLDREGNIKAYSAPPGKVKLARVDLAPVRRYLDNPRIDYPILGDDPRHPDRRKPFSTTMLRDDKQMAGYLYIVLGGDQLDRVTASRREDYLLKLVSWAVVLSLLFAFLSGLLVFYVLTRRLRRLTEVMDAFRHSDFSETAVVSVLTANSSGDEIERLGLTFRQMARRIIEQVQRLKETDAMRRRLIVNVSHDLRTPMVSVQGYLETLLLKEGRLDPAARRAYIEIALKASQRLNKLALELFELAKLEFQETELIREPFALTELVQDVIQEFRLTAKQKKVTLRDNFSVDLPYVVADIGLIERVFVNLIDNALRHAPEGGTIDVSLILDGDFIKVRVCDNGKGIAVEDLPFIFDPLYRAQRDERRQRTGAGLGLAIVKRILELHGSSIAVQNAPRGGACFSFALPLEPNN